MFKKHLSVILSIIMVITLLPLNVLSESVGFTDMPNDWSTPALKEAIKNGLLTGSGGKIMPGENLTRAQMATIINRAFGAEITVSLSKFTDVKTTDWFYQEMAKAVAMKTFQGSGDKLNPNNPITREEAFVVISRALNLDCISRIPAGFIDLGDISVWAKESLYAMINSGYIKGSNGRINPKGYITRAEFAQVMSNIIEKYIKESGEYSEEVTGNLMINTKDVTIKDSIIKGDLIIGDGVGSGEVVLDNIEVTGRLLVRGGGKDSILIKGNSVIGSITISNDKLLNNSNQIELILNKSGKYLSGYGWGSDNQLQIDIYKKSNIEETLYINTDSNGHFNLEFSEEEILTIKEIIVTKGIIQKSIFNGILEITKVDIVNDIVEGTSLPNKTIQVIVDVYGQQIVRSTTTDSNGRWIVYFSEMDPDTGSSKFDINFSTSIIAQYIDEDGDYLQLFYIGTTIHFNKTEKYIYGSSWGVNNEVTIEIYRTNVPLEIVYLMTNESGYFIKYLTNEDILSIEEVLVIRGELKKSIVNGKLEITNVDVSNDIIQGLSEPNNKVVIVVDIDNQIAQRITIADGNGEWVVDFSKADEYGNINIFDIKLGGMIQAQYIDEDNDYLQTFFRESMTILNKNLIHESDDFYPRYNYISLAYNNVISYLSDFTLIELTKLDGYVVSITDINTGISSPSSLIINVENSIELNTDYILKLPFGSVANENGIYAEEEIITFKTAHTVLKGYIRGLSRDGTDNRVLKLINNEGIIVDTTSIGDGGYVFTNMISGDYTLELYNNDVLEKRFTTRILEYSVNNVNFYM